MPTLKEIVWNSLMAGVMIGIGCVAYCSSPNPIVGSLLFSLGLITVLMRGYYLYTGRVGDAEFKAVPGLIVMFILNAVGIFGVAMASKTFLNVDFVSTIAARKEFSDLWAFFFKAIGCGMCMAIAVKWYHRAGAMGAVLPVMVFVLAGFEHSVADVFYLAIGGVGAWKFIYLTVIAMVGNAIGAKMICYWPDKRYFSGGPCWPPERQSMNSEKKPE